MKNTTSNVHNLLGLLVDDAPRGKKRLRAADYKAQTRVNGTEAGGSDEAFEEGASARDRSGKLVARQSTSKVDDRPQIDDDSEELIEDYNNYDSRLGNSSDDESHVSEVDIFDDEHGGALQGVPVSHDTCRVVAPSSSASSSGSPSPSPSLSTSPPPQPSSKTKLSRSNSTTFLPTLSGGYWSGSEGSNEDENEVEDLSTMKPRKNRRGQQERRAIWEKKYGANANHVKKQGIAGSKPSRDEGLDPKRGARGGNTRGGRGGRVSGKVNGTGRGGSRGMIRSGPNSDPVNGARQNGRVIKDSMNKKSAEGPLHPSWEAKKRAKEKAGNTMVAFQGKKVTFD